jgi:polyisoprenoid-binding protein YceI
MKKKKLLILFLLISSSIFADEWHVKKDSENLVKFTSSTTILDFDGTTNNIDGYIYWEGEKIFSGKNEIYFEVDLNTIKTGIGKRDRDMREDVLETEKWPVTYFKGSFIKVEKKGNQNIYSVKISGKMFIHGVEKEMEILGEIKIESGVMNVESKFSIYLKDFNIEAPSLLAFIKVAEEIKLKLNFKLEQTMENDN